MPLFDFQPDKYTLIALGFVGQMQPYTALTVDERGYICGWDIDRTPDHLRKKTTSRTIRRMCGTMGKWDLNDPAGFCDEPEVHWVRVGYLIDSRSKRIDRLPKRFHGFLRRVPDADQLRDIDVW